MISLVTACMNRESHLRRSLPAWLKLKNVDEIVLVDWSTGEPFDDLLKLDPRIRIVRVEGESRWILAYAYNLGIAQSRGDVILKCDADCLPSAAVLQLEPTAGRFFAGDWRNGDRVGKTCVNGQCLFTRDQWTQVNGYSELMRRYGHDDGDFYERLEAGGHVRCEITPELLEFLNHSDLERIANATEPPPENSIEAFLNRQLHYHEIINKLIAGFIPWGPWFPRADYHPIDSNGQLQVFRRDVSREIPLSPALQQLARTQAIRTLTSRLCKIPPALFARMDETACLAHLVRLAQKGDQHGKLPLRSTSFGS